MSTSHSAADRPVASSQNGRRRRFVWLALPAILAAVMATGSAPAWANGSACTVNADQGKLCVTVSDTPDPVAYSAFDGNSTFLSYHTVVSNQSRSSNLSHVGMTESVSPATTVQRVTATGASCGNSAQAVTCTIGQLKKGQSATVDVVVTAPSSTSASPPDSVINDIVTASFDERFNDQIGGKQDTVTYTEPTTVSKSAGQSYIPQGSSGKVDTDPAAMQYGNVSIPNVTSDVLASLSVLPTDGFCVLGQVTIQGTVYVCRNGGWLAASVKKADGSPYSNTTDPLVFHLRWSASQSSFLQNQDNFVVFYRKDATSPVTVISARCDATASNKPCLRNIVQEAGGGWSVDVVKPDNGHMR